MKFGFLATIDAPLLPLLIESAVRNGVHNICVICDSRTNSKKDMTIWKERTRGELDANKDGNLNIYKNYGSNIPFFL